MVGFVDQMMTIRITGLEGSTVARPQDLLASVGHEGQLALDHPNKLVLMAMPVALTGPTAGRYDGQVHPEARETL